jgi:hypothetical protein
MIIKLDMANAFEKFQHSFIFSFLAIFGFGADLLA